MSLDKDVRPPPEEPGEAGNDAALHAAARRHRALGEPVRLRMLQLVGKRPRTVGELAAAVRLSASAASRHLTVLADCGLVERRRESQWVVCRPSREGIAALTGGLEGATAAHPQSGEPALSSASRKVADLRGADPDQVRLCLVIGASQLRHGVRERAEWDWLMQQQFGAEVESCLDLLRTAVLRIARGEPLDGLPLPPELLADEARSFAGFAFPPGTSPPAE